MARKVGQVVARGRRRWLVRIYLGRDHQSRRRKYLSRTVHGPLRAAQRYLNERLRERDQGRDLNGSAISLNVYLDRWLKMAAKPRLRSNSYRDYDSLLRRYVCPALGDRLLPTLVPLDIQAVYQAMRERGLGSRTVEYTHAVLHSALEQAVKWRFLPENPSTGVQLPRRSRTEMRVMTADEVRHFLDHAARSRYGLIFALAVTTGMRPSEYLALRWTDIDFERGTMSVARTLEKGSGWRFQETKRARSRRVIQLQSWVVSSLRNFYETHATKGDRSEQIFQSRSGDPINADYLARQFKAVVCRAGLPPMRLYDLRHTAATLALAAGVPAKIVSEQLGHANSAFTLDVYSHVLPHMQQEAARRVEALLRPTTPRRKPPQSVRPRNHDEALKIHRGHPRATNSFAS